MIFIEARETEGDIYTGGLMVHRFEPRK